jgi:hypothetical protein
MLAPVGFIEQGFATVVPKTRNVPMERKNKTFFSTQESSQWDEQSSYAAEDRMVVLYG